MHRHLRGLCLSVCCMAICCAVCAYVDMLERIIVIRMRTHGTFWPGSGEMGTCTCRPAVRSQNESIIDIYP